MIWIIISTIYWLDFILQIMIKIFDLKIGGSFLFTEYSGDGIFPCLTLQSASFEEIVANQWIEVLLTNLRVSQI